MQILRVSQYSTDSNKNENDGWDLSYQAAAIFIDLVRSARTIMIVITDSPPNRPAGHNTDKVLAIAGPDDQWKLNIYTLPIKSVFKRLKTCCVAKISQHN